MIIDSHAHIVMPDALYRLMAGLVGSRANPPRPEDSVSDEALRKAATGLIAKMDEVGTDIQFISPRPYMMLHSLKPAAVSQTWNPLVNDVIARQVKMFPERFRGVAALPQYRDSSPANCID